MIADYHQVGGSKVAVATSTSMHGDADIMVVQAWNHAMISLYTLYPPPSPCGYLPDRNWRLRYEVVGEITSEEYAQRMIRGWRRFGFQLFRPDCPSCRECRSLRVDVARFRPSESQKRAVKANKDLRIVVDVPTPSDEKLQLFDKYHAFQADFKGWPERGPESTSDYSEAYVENPFENQEWTYFLGDRLIGVGFVDPLPIGLSAIYFFYDPDLRDRSMGTFNVLSIIEAARRASLPHVYLGYLIEGCRSSEYKAKFRPNEILGEDEAWRPFLEK